MRRNYSTSRSEKNFSTQKKPHQRDETFQSCVFVVRVRVLKCIEKRKKQPRINSETDKKNTHTTYRNV